MIGERKRKPDEVNRAKFLALTVQIERLQREKLCSIAGHCQATRGCDEPEPWPVSEGLRRAEVCERYIRIVALSGPMSGACAAQVLTAAVARSGFSASADSPHSTRRCCMP